MMNAEELVVVALFVGKQPEGNDSLLEIYRTKDGFFHYREYGLKGPSPGGFAKSIGFIDFDPSSDQPSKWLRQNAGAPGTKWTRLR